jgi:type IV secretion system protein VirB10
MNPPIDPIQGSGEPQVTREGIVSVNSRGSSGGNPLGKVFFVVGVLGLILVAGFYTYNKYHAAQQAKDAAAKQTNKNESKPAAAGITRDFEKEQATADLAAAQASNPPVPGSTSATASQLCTDGSAGTDAIGPGNQPLLTKDGLAMRVCPDGHIIVPNIGSAAPIPVAGQANGAVRTSRYGGDALVAGGSTASGSVGTLNGLASAASSVAADPGAQAAYVQGLVNQTRAGVGGSPAGAGPGAIAGPGAPSPAPATGSIGSQLTPSTTQMGSASMLGDRNMILPKGRSIDCGLSVRLVNDLPGLASCIVSQNVYSDNGKVLLLERGSEAVGEYSSSMAQGQKRLFVLWTRIKTPTGVVINLNSPGADELGTSGLPGKVNNHWWERLGAAALLTIVQDAIAYKTAEVSNGSTASLAVYQNTGQTTNNMADTILASTINIKPTLYKNQGDRTTIYVARDLDFGTVYALRPR